MVDPSPLLPNQPRGVPRVDNCRVLNGILRYRDPNLAKVGVEGSNPFARSSFFLNLNCVWARICEPVRALGALKHPRDFLILSCAPIAIRIVSASQVAMKPEALALPDGVRAIIIIEKQYVT